MKGRNNIVTKGTFFNLAKKNRAYSYGEYDDGLSCYFRFKIEGFEYNIQFRCINNKQIFLIDNGEEIVFKTNNEYIFLEILKLIKKEASIYKRRLEKTNQWNSFLKKIN